MGYEVIIAIVIGAVLAATMGHQFISKKSVNAQVGDANKVWRALGEALGLTVEEVDVKAERNVHSGGGVIMRGTYKDVSVEIRQIWKMALRTGATHHHHTYTTDNAVKVDAPGNPKWSVHLKHPNVAEEPTGVPAFDAVLDFCRRLRERNDHIDRERQWNVGQTERCWR